MNILTLFPYCRLIPMIENGEHSLPDNIFNATSNLTPEHAPEKARLRKKPTPDSGSWSPMINDQMQYLELNLGHTEPIYGVIMAGSPEFNNYVTLFKVNA